MILSFAIFTIVLLQAANISGTSQDDNEDYQYSEGAVTGNSTLDDDDYESKLGPHAGLPGSPHSEATEERKPAKETQQTLLPSTTSSSVKATEEREMRMDPQECGDPLRIEHTVLLRGKKSRYSEGDVVLYGCEFGYSVADIRRTGSRIGSQTEYSSECFMSPDTGKLIWTDLDLSCRPMSCGDPGYVAHARRVGFLFTFPNSISFECEEGFEMTGHGTRYCQPSGSWSGTLPSCRIVFCDEPPQPEHGRVHFNSLEYGTEVRYTCDEGHLLSTSEDKRVCTANGTWSGEDPQCQEAQCHNPSAPIHGSVKLIGDKAIAGTIAVYTCAEGRTLVGSATSKCLDIGQWTFPAPSCTEPCSVPPVEHGRIGKYESHRGRKRLIELAPGTIIEDENELVLLCESKYEPLGKPNSEEKINCKNGVWMKLPICEPEKCRTPPPVTDNGKVSRLNRTHGGTVIYSCNKPHFEKVATGNVTCQFGSWKGPTPKCKDMRCHVNELNFRGIDRSGTKSFYNTGESFVPQCEAGFNPIAQDNKFICNKGNWTGRMPPCTAAECTKPPPEIEHGFVSSNNVQHSSEVTYECDQPYQLQQTDKVQCLFGEWTGTPPVCADARCYLRDLRNLQGLSIDTEETTQSDASLKPECLEGFFLSKKTPSCSKGAWTQTEPACLENGCLAYALANGKFTVAEERSRYNAWKFGYDYWTDYITIPVGRTFAPGSSVFVTCIGRYTFQGKGTNHVPVKCNRGQWEPSAWCLLRSDHFREQNRALRNDEALIRSRDSNAASSTPRSEFLPIVTSDLPDEMAHTEKDLDAINVDMNREPEAKPAVNQGQVDCYCTYRNADENVVAFAGNDPLRPGSLVKWGCEVHFRCLHYGYARLEGSPSIKCTDCREWHSSVYPECRNSERGDAVIRLNGTWQLSPGGYAEVAAGELLEIMCISNGIASFGSWHYPLASNIELLSYKVLRHEGDEYTTRLRIRNAGPLNQGIYRCNLRGYRPNLIELKVRTPTVNCSKFSEGDEFLIHYDKQQAVNSSALFTCKRPSDKLVGASVVTCMSNGKWSGEAPECRKQCPSFHESEGMTISYSSGQETGSRATFHCFEPRVRDGVSFTSCQWNGEWRDKPPTCELPSCEINSLYQAKVLPEGIVPDMKGLESDTLPFNATLRLTCEGDLKILGSDIAVCSNRGQWKVDNVQCVPGCPSFKIPDSELIVEPEKVFYRFGEFVTLSCPPGQELTTELERIMCLEKGWSEDKVPACQAP